MMENVRLKELGGTVVMVPEIMPGTSQFLEGTEPLQRGIELGAASIGRAEMYQNGNMGDTSGDSSMVCVIRYF
jgi:hypothetical protein